MKPLEFPFVNSLVYDQRCIAILKTTKKEERPPKESKKNVIKKSIMHEDYRETLFNNKQMHHKMKTIRSQNHELSSYEINKVSLSCFDDKRYIHEDGITSHAYGHKKISNISHIP